MLQAVAEVAQSTASVANAVAVEASIPRAEAVVNAATETAQAKEAQPKPSLWQETKMTAKILVNQVINEVSQQIKDAGGDKAKIDVIISDPKARALVTIDQLRTLRPGEQVSIPEDQQVTIADNDGWNNTIVGIVNVVGESFQVMVIDANNKTPHLLNELVDKQALEKAHLVQKLAPQLKSFPESQAKIIGIYLESVKSGQEPASLPDGAEKMLLEAAQSAGILTTNDIELLIKQSLPDKEAGPDATALEISNINEANEKLANKRTRLLQPFADHGVIVTEPKQVITLLDGLGVGPTQLSETRNKYALEFTRLGLKIKANEKMVNKNVVIDGKTITITKELLRSWQEEQIQIGEASDALFSLVETLNKEGPIKQYFDQLDSGTLSQEEGQLVVESFRSGKIAEPPDIQAAVDSKSQEKIKKMQSLWKKQDTLSRIGKGTAISSGILGALAAFAMFFNKKEA